MAANNIIFSTDVVAAIFLVSDGGFDDNDDSNNLKSLPGMHQQHVLGKFH
jgi:hypothetical protein